jgi:hypothetical protein
VIAEVVSSNLTTHPMRRWQSGNAADCKSAVYGHRWFESIPAHQASMVQWIGRRPPKPVAQVRALLEALALGRHVQQQGRMPEWLGVRLQSGARRFDPGCGFEVMGAKEGIPNQPAS